MTTISTHSLASILSPKDNSTSGTSQQSTLPSLSTILATADGTDLGNGNTSSGNSYLLDLSPSAQAYLTNLNSNGSASSQGSATSSNGNGIVLNNDQKAKLDAILAKYKDAPYTDETFQKIQQDMSLAGIAADELAAKNQMRHLNPTLMLLNALAGGDGSVGTIGGSADIATETTNFMGKVADMWKSISTTVDDADSEAVS